MSGTPKKTSLSPYQVLGNRPIDQWKVTELKEELKRRKLITRGLKDDLVRRLDEALRIERESEAAAAEANLNGVSESQVQDIDDNVATPERAVGESGKHNETPQKVDESKIEKTDDDWVKVNAVDNQTHVGEQNDEAARVASDVVLVETEVVVVQETVVDTLTETVLSETQISIQEISNENVNSEAHEDKPVAQLENESSKPEVGTEDCEDSKTQNDIEKPVHVDTVGSNPTVLGFEGLVEGSVKLIATQDQVSASGQEDAPFLANQVSEVSPSLGLEVKTGSISSDSVSIVEQNELKDNIIADKIKFELNVKPEMVQPSSVNIPPDDDGSQSHPMYVEDPLEKKLSADDQDGNSTGVAKTSADMEYPEKLNLDRSSGDDSMDEDLTDNKQMDTKTISSVYEDKNVQVKVEIKDELVVDVVSEGKENNIVEDKGVVSAEKRKMQGQQSTGNNEPVKRQRRWNSESVKVTERKITVAAVSTTPKESISPAVGRHGLLKPDSSNSEDASKEREVPPSANPPTNSLRIDRFLRPFTLKAVQELLGKTGKVISFWMDHIKTHCYVTYSSVEEAVEARDAVYNLQWPTNGGRLLVADFVDPQEVKNRVEPPSPAAPISAPPPPQASGPAKQPQSSPRQVQRQQPALQTAVPPPPHFSAPPSPPLQENVEPPIVTLDDLFRKTNRLPRIYYLPLSEELVAEKIAAHGENAKT